MKVSNNVLDDVVLSRKYLIYFIDNNLLILFFSLYNDCLFFPNNNFELPFASIYSLHFYCQIPLTYLENHILYSNEIIMFKLIVQNPSCILSNILHLLTWNLFLHLRVTKKALQFPFYSFSFSFFSLFLDRLGEAFFD